MGGSGKTELAIQYALKYAHPESSLYTYKGGVCWLRERGEDIASQIITFSKVQLNLNIPEELDLEAQVTYCWRNWHFEEDILVVFDDVTNYKNIKPYLPSDSKFKIVVTTRLKRLAQVFKRLELEILSKDEALNLLKSLAGIKRINNEIETAKEICEWLGYLPLGLELVGQYLAERNNLPLEKMQERLKQKRLEQRALVKPTIEITAQLGVAAAFELSWQELSEETQLLAYFLSLFALAPIPWWIDDEDLEDIRQELIKQNLLKQAEQNTYQLHQLVREFIRNKLETTDFADDLKSEHCQLIIGIAQTVNNSPTLTDVNNLSPWIPHLEVATNLINWIDDNNLIWLFTGLGGYYKGQGLYNLAEPWQKQCLEVITSRLGEEHPDMATSLNNLALLYNFQGRYKEAEALYIQALELRRKLLGEEHLDVATSLSNLGLLYNSQGRYKEAEPLLIQALELYKKLLGEEHPSVARSLNNLAGLYYTQRRYKKAEPLYIQALELYKKLLGEEHPDTAESLNNLAGLYHAQGKYKKAEPLYIQALELKRKLLGEEHPYVARSLNNLAGLYYSRKRYKKAEPLFIQALELYKKLLGEEHPSVAQSLSNLAGLYQNQGRYEEAEPLYIQAILSLNQNLGRNHPNTNSVIDNFLYFLQQVIEKNQISKLNNYPLIKSILKTIINQKI